VAFTKAEQSMADGKYDAALAAYNALLPSAKGWQKDLIQARAEQAQEYRTKPPSRPAASSKPADDARLTHAAPKPAGDVATSKPARPTSLPATPPRPIGNKTQTAPNTNEAGGDLATVDRMVETLRKRPRPPQERLGWQKLGEQERAEAVRQYEQEIKRWDENHEYRGRSVTWTAAFTAIHKRDKQVIVELTSPAGYLITADLAEASFAAAGALKAGQTVEVKGTIDDYRIENESGGLFDAGAVRFGVAVVDATVKPAAK
jgi:hypothetical protein